MKILVVDDERSIVSTITDIFDSDEVIGFEMPDLALSAIRKGCNYDIVIMDYKMHNINGIELLKEIKKVNGSYKAILLTAYSTEQALEEGLNNELFHRLIRKSFDPEELKRIADELYETLLKERQEKQNYYTGLQNDLKAIISSGTALIYSCSKMKKVHETAVKIAKSSINVLIEGESGTGKEIIAQIIHVNSNRAAFPLINVNCSSISENVFESEMFGHRKGAFTGAITIIRENSKMQTEEHFFSTKLVICRFHNRQNCCVP